MFLKHLLSHLFVLFAHHGGAGLLILGTLDTSFLFMPLGNDLLVIAMGARKHALIPYYAVMAAAGSTLGALLLDLVFRKGGEKELEKHVSARRLEYLKQRMSKDAAWALIVASLMPPPFPFTPFVAGAAALQYPRRKLLIVIGCARLVRFSIEGVLAIYLGKKLLEVAESAPFEYAIGALIGVCIGGSVYSIYRWIVQSKSVQPQGDGSAKP